MLYPVIALGFLLALIAALLGYPDTAVCIIMLLWFVWLLAIIFRDAIRLQEKAMRILLGTALWYSLRFLG